MSYLVANQLDYRRIQGFESEDSNLDGVGLSLSMTRDRAADGVRGRG